MQNVSAVTAWPDGCKCPVHSGQSSFPFNTSSYASCEHRRAEYHDQHFDPVSLKTYYQVKSDARPHHVLTRPQYDWSTAVPYMVCRSRFKDVVTTSNCRMGWLLKISEQGRRSGAPFPSDPNHSVRKQTLESCCYVDSIPTQFEPVLQHFSERSKNKFGVNRV